MRERESGREREGQEEKGRQRRTKILISQCYNQTCFWIEALTKTNSMRNFFSYITPVSQRRKNTKGEASTRSRGYSTITLIANMLFKAKCLHNKVFTITMQHVVQVGTRWVVCVCVCVSSLAFLAKTNPVHRGVRVKGWAGPTSFRGKVKAHHRKNTFLQTPHGKCVFTEEQWQQVYSMLYIYSFSSSSFLVSTLCSLDVRWLQRCQKILLKKELKHDTNAELLLLGNIFVKNIYSWAFTYSKGYSSLYHKM